MGKGKLAKFADMERYENVFQYPFSVADNVPFDMKGHWREMYFTKYDELSRDKYPKKDCKYLCNVHK